MKTLKLLNYERNPLQRGGEPQEIAKAALYLASDEASYGDALVVGGGLSSSHPPPTASTSGCFERDERGAAGEPRTHISHQRFELRRSEPAHDREPSSGEQRADQR